ncbi:phosphoglycerate mutase family protein [Colletotrichum truncatum]|uniref:Phosphoglycerate mutase family protein n=1 Tax=Colletotrichum truncatum TaxID=5467 RepID=A0ACC3YN80_COLTU|nr:phosphoglycerate mutase family protein [Colletotrichum truncatum]KAF6789549.1 phosphoglycerate mutase family protein [Colletotrichum truncatum]
MGRPPAYIFVVRHGARLDAADKKWHLTSPTPYDPPLTYGGWQQSKALGVRIANILRQAEAELNANAPNGRDSSTDAKKRRKFKVVLHSSPFLRCVQTSIAISAGLAQAPALGNPSYPMPSPSANPSSSPFVLPASVSEEVDPLCTDAGDTKSEPPKKKVKKSILRLDAFLGEWLSPEYFEMITPPPGSAMMLAGAKADLLRRENISVHDQIGEHHHHHANSVGQSQSQLWNSPKFRGAERSGSTDSNAPSVLGLDNASTTSGARPRSRADSAASSSSQRVRFMVPEPGNPNDGYVAPTPNYATSPNLKIPDGYVAHARDACVQVDYQWDSMRGPLDWGDGGKYGEEWTAMHQRFRKGVQKLVDWYTTAERPAEMVTKTVKTSHNGDNECAIDDEDDDDIEPVVILVSHGAGCNALIGAITHQPVLMDVAMASLTMAVRKPGRETEPSGLDTPLSEVADPLAQDGVIPVHQYYDLKLFANTDHLRPSSSSTHNLSRAPSTASNQSQNGQSGARGRVPAVNSTYTPSPVAFNPESFIFPGNRSTSANASLGSMRRTSHANAYSLPRAPALNTSGITVGSGVTSFTNSSPTLSVGLWSPITPKEEPTVAATEEEDEDDDIFPDFDHRKKLAALSKQGPEIVKPPTPEKKEAQFGGPTKVPLRFQEISRPTSSDGTEEENTVPPLSFGNGGGLWGAPRPLGETEIMRDMTTSKRRWTVNERA